MSYVPKPMFEAGLAVEYFKNQHAKRAFRTDADREKDQAAINRMIALYNYCEERNGVMDANTELIREYEAIIRQQRARIQALSMAVQKEEEDEESQMRRLARIARRNGDPEPMERYRAFTLQRDRQRELTS